MFERDPVKHVQLLGNVIRYFLQNKRFGFEYPKLEKKNLILSMNSDASIANSFDLSWQLGYITLMYHTGRCRSVAWSSHKAKRVSRFVLGVKTVTLVNAFDTALIMQHELQEVLGVPLSIFVSTGTLSFFEGSTCASPTTEKIL